MTKSTKHTTPLSPQSRMSGCYKLFDLNEFSSHMINNRIGLKISLRTAAKQIGIHPATLSRIEHKKYIPDLETYYKCCRWMDFSMEYFF